MKFLQFVEAHGEVITRQKGEHLFHQGDHDCTLYAVRSGLLKAYYISSEGKESTKSFIKAGDTIGSLKEIMSGEGCSFSLVCLEPSSLIALEFEKLQAHSKSDVELAGEMIDFLLAFGAKKENREFELLCLSAEDRYLRLQETMPDLFERVTQNEIARYLGITPVALSRIKGRQ